VAAAIGTKPLGRTSFGFRNYQEATQDLAVFTGGVTIFR
jgi:hypothetical protein